MANDALTLPHLDNAELPSLSLAVINTFNICNTWCLVFLTSLSRLYYPKRLESLPTQIMPPKKAAAANEGDAPIGLTENELRFIKAVFDNMTQKPDANWDLVAHDLGLKDAKCAKERFRQMSVRHGWRDQPATPKKSTATKGSSVDVSKVKKTRAPRKTAAKPIVQDKEEIKEESDEEIKDETEEDGEI
ncbi:hypothetical protein XA68_11547 [Ophiocordyceps unilateralis]|uniref:Myb-like domain-containing protein n=1 Tax=Ophiocordyceps unilateralis TaxID=268505 RepID=A0A2A9PGR2_OPHUN|nr:hypothetical protein XA68_11547 [Ophiocordyceps unilateralis]